MTSATVELRFEDVCSVHWPVPSDELGQYVPDGTTVDTYEGQAWLSVVGVRVRPRFLPTGRGYAQVTVGTYLAGEPSVYLLDVVADEWIPAQAERILSGIPSRYGHVTVAREGHAVEVRCITHDDLLEFDVVPDGAPRPPAAASFPGWLVDRYRFVREDGTAGAFDHGPWRVQAAAGDVDARSLLEGYPDPDGDPVFLYSPGHLVRW